jgi:hypothetical protein
MLQNSRLLVLAGLAVVCSQQPFGAASDASGSTRRDGGKW